MNTIIKLILGGSLLAIAIGASAADDCKKLQDEKNLIYAAHGYCFKDKDAQKEFGTQCHTKNPKLSNAESKRIAQINANQKELKCPKKD